MKRISSRTEGPEPSAGKRAHPTAGKASSNAKRTATKEKASLIPAELTDPTLAARAGAPALVRYVVSLVPAGATPGLPGTRHAWTAPQAHLTGQSAGAGLVHGSLLNTKAPSHVTDEQACASFDP